MESPRLTRSLAERLLTGRRWLLVLGALAVALPTFAETARLSWSTEQGAHGPIVLATGIWLIARNWKEAWEKAVPPSGWKVAAFALPLLAAYFLSSVTQVIEVQGFVMYGLLVTALYSELGSPGVRRLAFPLVYLLFIFPPPDTMVAALTQPIKIAISEVATSLLRLFEYPIASSGVTMQIGQYQLLVAAACSGLNSLISLCAISLFYVYMRHRLDLRYAAFMMLAIFPIAIFANFVRVLILILLTYHAGEAAAQGFLHDFAGMTMFVTALLSIMLLDKIAAPAWRRFFPGGADDSD